MSEKGLELLSKQSLLDKQKTQKLNFCEHCVYGKDYKVKFTTGTHKVLTIPRGS